MGLYCLLGTQPMGANPGSVFLKQQVELACHSREPCLSLAHLCSSLGQAYCPASTLVPPTSTPSTSSNSPSDPPWLWF